MFIDFEFMDKKVTLGGSDLTQRRFLFHVHLHFSYLWIYFIFGCTGSFCVGFLYLSRAGAE